MTNKICFLSPYGGPRCLLAPRKTPGRTGREWQAMRCWWSGPQRSGPERSACWRHRPMTENVKFSHLVRQTQAAFSFTKGGEWYILFWIKHFLFSRTRESHCSVANISPSFPWARPSGPSRQQGSLKPVTQPRRPFPIVPCVHNHMETRFTVWPGEDAVTSHSTYLKTCWQCAIKSQRQVNLKIPVWSNTDQVPGNFRLRLCQSMSQKGKNFILGTCYKLVFLLSLQLTFCFPFNDSTFTGREKRHAYCTGLKSSAVWKRKMKRQIENGSVRRLGTFYKNSNHSGTDNKRGLFINRTVALATSDSHKYLHQPQSTVLTIRNSSMAPFLHPSLESSLSAQRHCWSQLQWPQHPTNPIQNMSHPGPKAGFKRISWYIE